MTKVWYVSSNEAHRATLAVMLQSDKQLLKQE